MKQGYRVVDADAHVIEPADLWERYIDAEFRDRAPRHLNLAFSVVTDGVSWLPVMLELACDWVWPITLGTWAQGPDETTRLTAAFGSWELPAAGLVELT